MATHFASTAFTLRSYLEERRPVLLRTAAGHSTLPPMSAPEPTRKRRSPSTPDTPADERQSFFGRRTFDLSRDLLCVLRADGTFKEANRAFEEAVGCGRRELEGRHLADCVHPDDLQRTLDEAARLIGGDHVTSGFENRYRKKDGSWIWLEWTARTSLDEGLIYASAREVSERKARELDLERAAHVDPLTGLANRRGFQRALERELAAARRYGRCPALILLDLDDFKQINDRHGHHVGDELLVVAAMTFEASLRESDLAARIGGDEFAVLLPDCDAQTAQLVAGKILNALSGQKLTSAQGELRISTSAGVALLGQRDVVTGDDLVNAADRAMYSAKRGRTALAVHDAPVC